MMFTVIIPTLNAKPEWLTRAVLSCSFADEIIITRERGLTNACNNAAHKASGEYISFLPDDDFYLPEINEIAEIARKSDADVVYFPCKHYREEEELPGLFDVEGSQTIYGSCFMRRTTFFEMGGYEGGRCQDTRWFHRARAHGKKFLYCPEAGGVFRWNDHSNLQKGNNA